MHVQTVLPCVVCTCTYIVGARVGDARSDVYDLFASFWCVCQNQTWHARHKHTRTHGHICIHTHTHTHTQSCTHTHTHKRAHIHTQTCTYAHKTQTCKYNCMHMCQQSVMHYLADGISPLNLIDHTNT